MEGFIHARGAARVRALYERPPGVRVAQPPAVPGRRGVRFGELAGGLGRLRRALIGTCTRGRRVCPLLVRYSPYVLEGAFSDDAVAPVPYGGLAIWHRTAGRVYSWAMTDEDA